MASQLSTEQHAAYSVVIDDILSTADLNTISAKAIRKKLQTKVDYDLTPQKSAITDLIMERFDKVHSQQTAAPPAPPAPTANGTHHHHHPADAASSPPPSATKRKSHPSDSSSSSSSSSPPPPKKAKPSKGPRAAAAATGGGGVESDEQLAARLQAELNAQSRATRGGGAKRKPAVKKDKRGAKKKSSAKVRADDDSDLEGEAGGEGKREKERKGGFHKPMNLSAPLAAMLGETQLSRPQTVKKIWDYVKAREMQDPSDKRQIICDDAMRAVFKGDKVHMFTMNKLLRNHLYPADEEEEAP